MKNYKNILLTGGTGKLGRNIQKTFPLILNTPSSQELEITDKKSLSVYFEKHAIDAVIHCAALSKLKSCESEPIQAINTNIIGTSHLVSEVLNAEQKYKKSIRFIHISTDGVYQGIEGNYTEKSPTIPHNNLGWSKLGAECAVQLLSNFCIIRTRFFDPEDIPFTDSATDVITSRMLVCDLVKAIQFVLVGDFVGTLNIGSKKASEYEHYKPYKPSLKTCLRKDLVKELQFEIAIDTSLDLSLWESLK